MKSLNILGKEMIQMESFNQLRFESGQRRIGLEFWIRYEFDGKEYWLQYRINEDSDAIWLKAVFGMGKIYLSRKAFNMTLTAAKVLDNSKKSKKP